MTMTRDDRIAHFAAAMGAALEIAQTNYVMLLDALDSAPEALPVPLVRSDDPELCQHPSQMIVNSNPPHLMCEECGKDLGPQFINGG